MTGTTLTTLLDAGDPHRPFAIDAGTAYSAARFERLVQATTGWLQAHGIGRDDRVAIWLVNRIEWLALLFALERLGATAVAVNTRYRSTEVQYLLARSKAKMLVMQPRFRGIDFPTVLAGIDATALAALEQIAVLDEPPDPPARWLGRPVAHFDATDRSGEAVRPPIPAPVAVADPDRLLILYTTSGTTSGPKLVMHTGRTLVGHAIDVAHAHGFGQAGAALLAALPLCGTFGLTGALAAIAAKALVVMLDAFDEQTAIELIRRHAITHLYGGDDMYRRLLEATGEPFPFASARVFGLATFSPGATDLAARGIARGLPLLGLYGSSEVQALFSLQSPSLPTEARLAGGGRPASAQAAVRIRDLSNRQIAPIGHSGEIEIYAPYRFTGYLDEPQATANAIDADGFFRTGDVGHLRDDGSFVYETRLGDVQAWRVSRQSGRDRADDQDPGRRGRRGGRGRGHCRRHACGGLRRAGRRQRTGRGRVAGCHPPAGRRLQGAGPSLVHRRAAHDPQCQWHQGAARQTA
ncbi:MAG: AMP-binding protein [Burkholderiaceae bacterium]